MNNTFKLMLRRPLIAACIVAAGLMGCDKTSQMGIMQHPIGYSTKGEIVPDNAYAQVLAARTKILDEASYLTITKGKRGSIFTMRSGPLPTPDHAVCFSSDNTPGFRECVGEYYHTAGAVAIQSNEAGWWATPL